MISFKEFLLENVYERQLKSGRQSGIVLGSSVIGNTYLPQLLKDKFSDKEPKEVSILDVGSGRHAEYTQKLRKMGYDAKAIDLPENMEGSKVHNPDAYSYQYDIAFAGRVLNVFSSQEDLNNFIRQISEAVKSGGYFLCNLPVKPRDFGAYENMSVSEGNEFLKSILENYFSNVKKIGNHSGPVFLCIK
jgi:uncharacterized UPF0146 family protein